MPWISASAKMITEKFKSLSEGKPIMFPKELGEEHPFSFEECEKLCKTFGLAKAAVDKHVDFTLASGFTVSSSSPKAQKIIEDFIKKTGFEILLREWLQEALIKGNGFMEIAQDKSKKTIDLKIINANNMFILRDEFGELIKYNQYAGNINKDNLKWYDKKKIIPFEADEIAHLPLNRIGDCAYGFGLISPTLSTTDNLMSAVKESHVLLKRKANNPIIANVGTMEEPATASDVQDVGQKLEYLNNMHEWSFDHRVNFKVLDFGNIGDKFSFLMSEDKERLFMEYQIPAVLMGSGFQNEGIANVQRDGFDRRILSIQALMEKIIEEKIFRVILNLNGLDAHVEFEWGMPSEEQINSRIAKLTELLRTMTISPQLRAMLERDLAQTLGYEEKDIDLLPKPELQPEVEREKEENIPQPEVPREKPQAQEHLKEMKYDEKMDNLKLTEWLNFDYLNYKATVLAFIQQDVFEDLKKNYTKKEIEQVRQIFLKNFENNGTIRDIMEDLKAIPRLKEVNRILIARTESTRLATGGLLEHYKSQGVKKVRFLATVSDRTCPVCEGLNGQVFSLNEAKQIIPVHAGCRCSYIKLEE